MAALNGFSVPPAADFDYCELGSAHGETTTVLAAANPRARFIGVDLSPAHITLAKQQATSGELDNVSFLERDFEDLGAETIPDFDFIAAHGVLSWIGPAKRKALLQFASAKLKPGGLLYVGYNAEPGWASVEPLRSLLVSASAGGSNDSQERARRGLALAQQLRDSGALYFKGNPAASAMLAAMEKMGPAYIAHEYLNAYWQPMYFAQVALEMAQNDLYFVGQLPLYMNYRDLVVPPPMSKLFEAVTDRATFESLKDYALNEFFRRDVFIKGRVGRSAEATQAYFDTTLFGAMEGLPAGREIRLPHHTLDFRSPLFDALFTAMGQGHAEAAALAQRPILAPYSAADVRAALLRSILGDCAGPMQNVDPITPSGGERLVVPSAYNRMVLKQTPSSDTPFVLGSQVTGRGHSISPLDAICIRLLTEVPRSNWESWTRALFTKQGVELTVRGDAVQDERERVRTVIGEVEKLRLSPRMARLLEWRVIERAA
ncbi:MAG: class I SAM-dependent methyltransferase [Polyangiaceae bacterium]